MTEQVRLYTTSPQEEDWQYKLTVMDTVGVVQHASGEREVRLITLAADWADDFVQDTFKAGYATHTEQEWQELIAQPFFQRKFTPCIQESTPMPAVTAHPRMEVLPNAPIDLVDFAAHINSQQVDRPAPAEPPKASEAPQAAEPPPESQPSTVPSNKPAMLEVLRDKARTSREAASAIQAVLDANNLPDMAKEGMRKMIADHLKQAEAYEAQAAKLVLTSSPEYQWQHASTLRAQVVLSHGSEALQAVETLVRLGVLGVSKGTLVVQMTVKPASAPRASRVPTSETQAERLATVQGQVQARKDNETRNAEIERRYLAGESETQIKDAMVLSPGTVRGVVNRAQLAGRVPYRKVA